MIHTKDTMIKLDTKGKKLEDKVTETIQTKHGKKNADKKILRASVICGKRPS